MADGAARPDHVTWLIDNASAYRALIVAIRAARHSIGICQLAFDADCVAYDVDVANTGAPDSSSGIRLLGELLDATGRGVSVRVLLNASVLLNTVRPLRKHLAAVGANRHLIQVRGVRQFPHLLHAKIVVVDDDLAFLIGSPFANGYWDDARHPPIDARRPNRELGGRPVHDVSTQLTGSTARELAATFSALWNNANDIAPDDRERMEPTPDRPDSRARTRIVRTAPGRGPMEILPALLDGIAAARSYIYIEHQYLSAPGRGGVARACTRSPPDPRADRRVESEPRCDRLPRLAECAAPRNGVAVPPAGRPLQSVEFRDCPGDRSPSDHPAVRPQQQVVAITDDRWATVGSGNLDGVSLHSYGEDFAGALGRRVFRSVRNYDVNVVVDGEHDGDEMAKSVRTLRTQLWQEHLGASGAADAPRPLAGWLERWRSIAKQNVDALSKRNGAHLFDGPFVLPYSLQSTPRAQLADVGVPLVSSAFDLCFEPSWLEVHVSPSWVRNMLG